MFPAAHGVVSQGGRGAAPPLGARGGPSVYLVSGWSIASLTHNVGWRFKVGANDITITHLRYYNDGPQTETIRLYRASDGALLRSAPVTTTGGWAEEPVTPVTLTAGHEYVIAHYAGGSARNLNRNPTTYQLDPAIEYIGALIGTTDAMPADASGQQYLAAAFRTQAAGAGYRFYRWRITANNGRSAINVAEAQLRAALGGSNVATGGAPYATSVWPLIGLGAASAFDGDPNTYWSSADGVTNAELWYDLGTRRERIIVQYALQARSNANNGSPRDWVLEASNDLLTWDALDAVTGETGWANGEQRVFTL